jgi:protein tyrosine phosphatase
MLICHPARGPTSACHIRLKVFANWFGKYVGNKPVYLHPVRDLAHSSLTAASDIFFPPTGPITVHCSAGVGRSGAFISILHTIERAHAGLSTNLMELVMEMRKDRSGMIQTKGKPICFSLYNKFLLWLGKKKEIEKGVDDEHDWFAFSSLLFFAFRSFFYFVNHK